MQDVAIIGCGIVGAAAAYTLSQYQLKLLILEKENDVAMGATRANSAIIHAGYDPLPGTLMARLNVEGNRMTPALCAALSVPFQKIGSLVLAFSEAELKTLQALFTRGTQNGVPELHLLGADELRRLEPAVSKEALGALYAPSAGIVNPWEYALALAEVAVQNGAELRRSSPVTALKKRDGYYEIQAGGTLFQARCVINAAGLESGRIHEMLCPKAFTIAPNSGEYYLMDKTEGTRARHVLFQCPNKDGKGVLIAPTVHGNLIVGPNARPTDGKRVNTTAEGLQFVKETAAKTMKTIDYRQTIRTFAGVRANSDQADFFIQESAPGFIDLACIKSPGLTAAPAIGLYCLELLRKAGLPLQKNNAAKTKRTQIRFKQLSTAEKKALIRENPLYGRVICRCETITEGEITAAIHSPIPPCSVDGVKRRAGTGMGRCQGGFCGPKVLDILSRERGIPPLAILKDGANSEILAAETKMGGEKE